MLHTSKPARSLARLLKDLLARPRAPARARAARPCARVNKNGHNFWRNQKSAMSKSGAEDGGDRARTCEGVRAGAHASASH